MSNCIETGKKSDLESVRVRMYRPGLGDCFLLTFHGENRDVNMLIDCGVFLGTSGGADRIREIVQDIDAQSNHKLDVVVATHEHWDHLSGFVYAQPAFESLDIDQVWLAWTEDPNNPLAQELRMERELKFNALHMALTNLGDEFGDFGMGLQEVLNFFGESLGAAGGRTTRAAMDFIATHRSAAIRYCYPREAPLTIENLPGVRIYVLGPPEDETLIKHSEPSTAGDEVYQLTRINLANSFFAALPSDAEDDNFGQIRDLCFPFDHQFRISREEAQQQEFFTQYYGFEVGEKDDIGWRRIDVDWLNMAGELALALDSDTNNTSLVLAIELVDTGKVMLFPADAQVGNWQSWHSHQWELVLANGQTKMVTARDLLARTVLYKVGHHGSHNATLRDQGLEMMNSQELVAMIPVDEQFAAKKAWKMPFQPLLSRLVQKTRGRVIRADRGVPSPEDLTSLTQKEVRDFQDAVRATDLFVDYTLKV